ncbi:hypothetical protein A3H38_00240 [candidate division WOR-1 bacterium RIFCSPLOWO2_02_FULL_46_20]|uniref:Uncharacterized protein n=2 Tax=Saganbacteria TaxID=1703751 RepID=A0A1F4R4S8_UNCSA|nr:MAG: hypothetical protein A3J44_06660 [candidate division WOR-1 bacterium RIFCSPHIGHO2_02_FULL_45_12]OGC03187.1 MAG: hypothetical protein A3H38_00240 [candidate division WOR-1 bacterium RIFCSPLOWO2_02_FULL_46_20]OGC09829.1 MAG: hypothetical protein A3F86_04005 [candidate division WOR-1 bacterium RIFCSPLOWO2_12_FULL_45_9]
MKFTPNELLFWFFKNKTKINLDNPADLDTYLQQVLTHGKTNDIKQLLKRVKPLKFQEAFERTKKFLPLEVKMFWEDFIGNNYSAAKRNP